DRQRQIKGSVLVRWVVGEGFVTSGQAKSQPEILVDMERLADTRIDVHEAGRFRDRLQATIVANIQAEIRTRQITDANARFEVHRIGSAGGVLFSEWMGKVRQRCRQGEVVLEPGAVLQDEVVLTANA